MLYESLGDPTHAIHLHADIVEVDTPGGIFRVVPDISDFETGLLPQ
jgi:hypothetical protein